MRAILVCVEYGDILRHTLAYNAHHFDEVMVVTTPCDRETIDVVRGLGERVYTTTAFYDDGAYFNKWKALEEALQIFEPSGLTCLMDADIMWPRVINGHEQFKEGYLYTPRRRLWRDVTLPIPRERRWSDLELFHEREFAGYTQIFYAEDHHLPKLPWHQTDWRTAGGADSFFQQLWPETHKIRPAWEVLHLGSPGINWCGRVSKRVDGTTVKESQSRYNALCEMLSKRGSGPTKFYHEKIRGYIGERLGASPQ